jgi:hypothetical protein
MKKILLILVFILLPTSLYAGSLYWELWKAEGDRYEQQSHADKAVSKSEEERAHTLQESRRYLSLEDAIRVGSDVWGFIDSDPKSVRATLDELKKEGHK